MLIEIIATETAAHDADITSDNMIDITDVSDEWLMELLEEAAASRLWMFWRRFGRWSGADPIDRIPWD